MKLHLVLGLSLCSVCALHPLLVKAVNFQVILHVLVHCGTWVKQAHCVWRKNLWTTGERLASLCAAFAAFSLV
jgi:hypothetical protein